jgi:hypothetical protein
MVRVRGAIEVNLEAAGNTIEPLEFVGQQQSPSTRDASTAAHRS